MRVFKGPRYQGGWIAIAASAAAAAYSSYKQDKSKKEDREAAQLDSKEAFARRAWLDQQQRAFDLQDRQYKEDAVAAYRPFYSGPEVATPERTSTAGLADWDPEAGVPLMNQAWRT